MLFIKTPSTGTNRPITTRVYEKWTCEQPAIHQDKTLPKKLLKSHLISTLNSLMYTNSSSGRSLVSTDLHFAQSSFCNRFYLFQEILDESIVVRYFARKRNRSRNVNCAIKMTSGNPPSLNLYSAFDKRYKHNGGFHSLFFISRSAFAINFFCLPCANVSKTWNIDVCPWKRQKYFGYTKKSQCQYQNEISVFSVFSLNFLNWMFYFVVVICLKTVT